MDVYKSNTSSPAFHSECGINTTDFSYPTPPDSVCHKYIFTVTPVNLVGNGTRTTEQFVRTDTGTINCHASSSMGRASYRIFFVGGGEFFYCRETMWLIDHSEGEGVGGGCAPSHAVCTAQKLTV